MMYCLGFIGTAAGLKNVSKETSIGNVFENTKYNSVLFLEILEPLQKFFFAARRKMHNILNRQLKKKK